MTIFREVVHYINGKRQVRLDDFHSPLGSELEDTRTFEYKTVRPFFQSSEPLNSPRITSSPRQLVDTGRLSFFSADGDVHLGIGAMVEADIKTFMEGI